MIPHGLQVVHGPSRENLFDALRLVHEDRTVKFEWIRPDDVREEIELKILAIGANGDEINAPKGGQSWKVHGYDISEDVQGDRSVFLIYSTQSRTGIIDFSASNIVGPSPLPVDDIGREGFFVEFIKRIGWFSVSLPVGPFETLEERSKFFKEWTEKVKEEDSSVLVIMSNVIPGTVLSVWPAQFTGLDMLPRIPYSEDFPPDDDDDDDDDELSPFFRP